MAISRGAKASFQIAIRLVETVQGRAATQKDRAAPNQTVVLRRQVQTVGVGAHSITLKLSRAATGRLSATGSLVLTVRVTVTAADGTTVTHTEKIMLTR